ncbi:MAG TPA: nuclear transport factor 2 family protein [Candidatus Binataceae bacterium]|nr:nuclear transport factor 2 family protein [Candidatus Binataceae bacterium]
MASDAEDQATILRLDNAWNSAYERNDRAPLADILADDFTGIMPWGEHITKATLMVNPPRPAKSISFSEQEVRMFGSTAISRGRLKLDLEDRMVDQRFLRVFSRRDGRWQAVAVSVTPVSE